MDKITENLRKADLAFGLRSGLEKLGFSQEEDLFIVFQHKDKEYKSGAIPASTENKASTLNTQNIKAALLDWINKAEAQEAFSEAVAKELGLPDDSNSPMEIKFVSDSFEVALSGRWYCPCSPTIARCCFR